MKRTPSELAPALALLGLVALPGLSWALDDVQITVRGIAGDDRRETLERRIRDTSLVVQAQEDEVTNTQDILGAAIADYRDVLGILYSEGYYGPYISITLDGREAAEIDPFSVPDAVRQVDITVDTGARFRFGETRIAPRAPEATTEPIVEGFARGDIARSAVVGEAVNAAVGEWRDEGHAKVAVEGEDVVADHRTSRLDVDVALDPGPLLRFGAVTFQGRTNISEERLNEILGWPTGRIYSPELLDRTVRRLRRTGTFSTVSVREAETPNPDGTLDFGITLVEQRPRTIGVTLEYNTLDGFLVNTFWEHRNLFGGAERLRVDAEISGVGQEGISAGQVEGVDYSTGFRLTRPGTFGADNDVFVYGRLSRDDEPDYTETAATLGVGLTRYFTENLFAEAAGGLRYSQVEDTFGDRDFYHFVLPSRLDWDRRNDPGDPSRGFFLGANLQPYIGFSGSESGAVGLVDGRTYYGFGTVGETASKDRIILAGRMQLGSVVGTSIENTPPEFLFYAGGGDTVRGYPYQSLGVDQPDGGQSGGRSFIGFSGEVRSWVTQSIGAVLFADAGYIGPDSFYAEDDGSWISGVGVGVRYATPIGPIRVDVATPYSGERERFSSAELYIGIGQAF